jgi:hypothetical protein
MANHPAGTRSGAASAHGGQGIPSECDANCASVATLNATPQASARGSEEPQEKTEPAATTQVAAGSSKLALGTTAGPRQDAAQKTAGTGHGWQCVCEERREAAAHKRKSPPGPGWPGGRKVAGTGTEQTRFRSGKQGVLISCDAECDAISADRIELLARAVVLVAGMRIPESAREAVLARLTADRASQNGSPTEL